MCLEDFKSVFAVPDINFVDLQYGDTKREQKDFKERSGFELTKINGIDNFNDIDKLASLISACDFIVTTSNVTAHIAGALNKKTYLIVPFTQGKIWYWGINKKNCQWYQSIKILNSNALEDWKKPVKELHDLLSKEIEL